MALQHVALIHIFEHNGFTAVVSVRELEDDAWDTEKWIEKERNYVHRIYQWEEVRRGTGPESVPRRGTGCERMPRTSA